MVATLFDVETSSITENGAESLFSVLDLFLQQARDTPHAPAVYFEDQTLSFADLEALVNRFASALVRAGVKHGQSVGLCINRCPEAIAAMLGAFRIGAVFVPLDPEYPLERIRYMIDDAQIRVIITHDRAANPQASALADCDSLTWIDSRTSGFAELSGQFDPVKENTGVAKAGDMAYIMYTSGSTGNPKGVQIEHCALTTYCLADIEVFQLSITDRTLQFSTLNFDIAIEEIFPPLLIGSSVVIRPRDRVENANELSTIIHRHEVTAIHLATAYWHEWIDLMIASQERVPSSLRLVIATGEKVSVEHYRRWQSICDHEVLWCNAYGPTEATVTSTVFIPAADFSAENMPIGRPLPGYAAYILTDDFQLAEPQQTGNLYIAGRALARGYLNRPELTEKAFVTVDLPDQGPTRLYCTGDLARWLPDGNIEFAGRIDHQIKLGSYRIEPGEIEAVLSKHAEVLDSLVVCEEVDGHKHLIAYAAVGSSTPTIEDISNHLRQHLPVYMVPQRYVLITQFPKTVNGKIDRAALPTADTSRRAERGGYVAPRTELERRLCEIWQQTLNVPQIGVHDDFFALGGSSLLVARATAALTRELHIALPVRDFFANPTVASSARHLQHLMGEDGPAIELDTSRECSERRERLPNLHPNFICLGTRQLFSVYYGPRQQNPACNQNSNHAILICNAYGHENTRAYRNLQQLALQLCGLGFHVLRFDYSGTGNSTGSCGSCRVETLQSDTRHAADYLRRISGCSQLSVVGIRLGATVAATANVDSVKQLLLWDPVVDGHEMLVTFQQLQNHALTSQTRYARVVQAKRDQLYGHSTNSEKAVSFSALKLPQQSSNNTTSTILVSQGYREAETRFDQLDRQWPIIQTADDIHWHDALYSECAFASADTVKTIISLLTEGHAS